MKVCPKCGWHEYLSGNCRACGTVLTDTLLATETSEQRYLRYKAYLDGWKAKKDEFLKFWKDKNSAEYFGYRQLLSEMDIFADEDNQFFNDLNYFKSFMFGELQSAEACIVAYLGGRTEDAFAKFRKFLSEETENRTQQTKLYKKIFVYYINLIVAIEKGYETVCTADGAKQRLKMLFKEVVSFANKLCNGLSVNIKGYKHSRFRIYTSEKYPDIHDDYIEYLKVLKKAVLGESVEEVLGEVQY